MAAARYTREGWFPEARPASTGLDKRACRDTIRTMSVSRTGSVVVLLSALLVLTASGCGSSSDKKANEAYANSVCTAIASWQQNVKAIATDFSSGTSKAALESKITQVRSATKQLVTEIKAVPAPNTSQGQAAKQQLDQLSTDISTTIDAANSAISGIPSDASAATISATLVALAPQVQSLATETKSAISSLKTAAGSLASAFKDTSSCQNLG